QAPRHLPTHNSHVPTSGPLGIYVHVPFCSAICNYCNFNRGLFDADLKIRYVEALRTEIARSGASEDAPYSERIGAPEDAPYSSIAPPRTDVGHVFRRAESADTIFFGG